MPKIRARGDTEQALKTVTDWDDRVTSYEYDGNGRLTKTTRPDGSVETRTYDANGKLVTIVDKNGENVINQTVYSYDESGNITNVDTTNAMGVTGLNSAEMVYNENNQLVKYNGETVKYDADGNMIYGSLNGEMAEFKYDCRNRLISAGGTTYAYDAENNRISKTVDQIKTEYVIDSTGSLTRILTASTDSKTTYFVYGIGLISQEDDNEILYYHFNNIGSTEAVTNLDGKIKEKFEYGPYGELTSENTCGIIFLYNGEYGVSTDENGLYYMRARYYNPEIKRFINQDVLTGSITDSPTLNRYAYVEGNPISLADPFGLSPAINWRGAGHTILGLLGLLTFVPGCQAIGIVANVINAAWYFAEGEIFNGICSGLAALPGLGGAAGKICSASGFSNAAMMIQKGTQIASNVGFMGTGFYTIGKMGYENYQKHVVSGEDFSFWDFVNDAVNGTFAVLSIYGGAKGLGFDKVNVPTKLKGCVYIGGSKNSNISYYFRGTTEGFPGNNSLQKMGITPTSTDPYVATVFATNGEQYGNGVLYIASSKDLNGISLDYSNVLSSIEREVTFSMLPLEFAQKSSICISASRAREIFASMGYEIPSNILRSEQSTLFENWNGLSIEEIIEFVKMASRG